MLVYMCLGMSTHAVNGALMWKECSPRPRRRYIFSFTFNVTGVHIVVQEVASASMGVCDWYLLNNWRPSRLVPCAMSGK